MKTCKFFFIALLFFFNSSYLFPQLDSVYYQGPSQGSVSSGAIQTTDIFSDRIIPTSGQLQEIPSIDRSTTEEPDMIFGWDESKLPEYRYIGDGAVKDESSGNGGQTVLLNSFPAIPMTNFIPPDPTIAVGPNHVIVCANSIFRILDKEGNVIKIISAASWWAPAWPDENGDPQVIYDHYSERWVLVWMQVNTTEFTAGNLIAYSDDDDPLGTWYMYRLDTKSHGTVQSNTWGDYPKVGYDEEALYIMTRCISFTGGHLYNKIRIINKSELYTSNAGPLTYTDIWDIRTPGQGSFGAVLDCISPGICYTPGNGGWFFWARGIYAGNPVSADFYSLYKVVNPLTAPTIQGKVLPVQLYTSPPLANQLGGGSPGIETIGWITKGPVIRDGYLYATHDIQNSTNSDYSSIKYLKVDLSTHSIVENIEFGAEGYFYLFPAITIDQEHNAAITYSRSADTEYIGAYFSTKYASDVELSPSKPIAEGQGNYVVTYGSGINRWGDYFGIYLDPANEFDVWTISEYAASTNIWGTYVGHIRMAPYPGSHTFVQPKSLDFGDVEIGTTSSNIAVVLANYGDTDLIVTDIPSSVGPFNLETTLSYPLNLASYDSLILEFSYSPTVLGNNSVIYEITSNDPEFDGIMMTGKCYRIIPSIEKTFYASSGSQNNGKILTINSTTGAGTNIGSSLFSEVKGLAINPVDGIIYGLVAYPGSSELVRVNAELGDSYLLFTLNIPSLSDIAFDTLGTLFAVSINGEIFEIDLTNGSSSLLVDAVGSFSGITFNQETNELWATSRAFVPPNRDAIFKVNLVTGDTTIIGHTGLGKITNDLVFDENLNLFGMTGSSSETNDFISINPSNGTGTVIGNIGLNHILGLAYIEDSPTNVEVNSSNLPEDYLLLQNYPNPFNPVTTIKFQIPSGVTNNLSGVVSVQLIVFDVLGNMVATLVNEDFRAGEYEVIFDSHSSLSGIRELPSGIYFYQLKASSFIQTKKMVLLK